MRLLILFSICLLGFSCSTKKSEGDFIISHINIVNVENGSILPDQFVLIKGSRIVKISSAEITADKAGVINGSGKYLIPGLWDMHTHFWWNYMNTAPLYVANGVTGVREMFGNMSVIKSAGSSTNTEFPIPEIVSSGPIIDGVPAVWPGSDTISTPQRAAGLIKKQMEEGVNFLKVYEELNRESYFAIAAEAKKANIPFAGHVPSSISIWEAIQAGQKSIEHLSGVIRSCIRLPEKSHKFKGFQELKESKLILEAFNENRFDSLAEILSKSDTWICPTLIVLKAMVYRFDGDFINDNRIKYLPAYMTNNWKPNFEVSTEKKGFYKKVFSLQQKLTGKLQKKGVKLLAGTDCGNPYCFPGFGIHDELQLLVESGLSPLQALQAATLNPAKYFHLEKNYGAIAESKLASLVILNKNPLENISYTKEINSVFLKGQYYNRSDLDLFLSDATFKAK